MNSMWSSAHFLFFELPCLLGGKNVHTHSCLSMSMSCHGGSTIGCITSVSSSIRFAMWVIHVVWFAELRVCLELGLWGGSGGGCVMVAFFLCLGGSLAIIGWSSPSHAICRASMSNLYSMSRTIRGMDASISIATIGVVLKAPVMIHRQLFWSFFMWFKVRLFFDFQYSGRPYKVVSRITLWYSCLHRVW